MPDLREKWNMIVDVARCENCHNCTIATKDEHIGNDFPGYAAPQPLHGHDWLRIDRVVRGVPPMVDAAYRPTMCNHCDDAPCIKRAGDDSVFKRPDGIVIFDPQKTKGRKDLVSSCPYGMIEWNEEEQVPQTWIFDIHLLDQGWKVPRCQSACPTDVYRAIKVTDARMAEIAAEENLRVLKPELGTWPRVYYKNLHRFDRCFVGGSVVAAVKGRAECVEGAIVRLESGTAAPRETQTDLFGDFKFDDLDRRAPYRLTITAEGHAPHTIEGSLDGESRYLGEIRLS